MMPGVDANQTSRSRLSDGSPVPRGTASVTSKFEFRAHHQHEAIRLRGLATAATTAAMRTRLLREAEKHEQFAEFGELLVEEDAG